MRLLPRRGGGRGRRIKGPNVVHVRRPVTLYGVRSPVRVGPRRRRLIPRRRRRGHHGMFKGLAAVLKLIKSKEPKVRRGGQLLRRVHIKKIRVHRMRHHRAVSFRIKAITSSNIRYRVKAYKQPKPPNEMPDIKAAIKGGFKP